MKKRPSLLAVLLGGAFLGSLAGTVLADAGVHLTLLENDEEAIETALLNKQPSPSVQDVYVTSVATTSNMPYNVFVRNPNLWIGSNVDLTAISAYSDNDGSYGTKFAITAISPVHCIGSHHCALHNGVKLNFVGSDNHTYTRSVMASTNAVEDIQVYLLNQPLPPVVKPMHILPPDWASYLKPGTELDLPAIFINQQNRLYCAEAAGIQATANPTAIYHLPSSRPRAAFCTQIISGDSSFPQMVLVNGVPAILSLWHYGGFGAGPVVAAHYKEINHAMYELSRHANEPSPFQLQPVDMTGIAKVQ